MPLDGSLTSSRLLDEDLPMPVRELLRSSVGHVMPTFDGVDWIAGEPVDEALMEGRIVVVQTWSWTNESGRAAPRRVDRLVRASGVEDVVVVSVHTPEGLGPDFDRYMERRRDRFPVPVAVDTTGEWLDHVGAFEEPTLIVADRAGRIRVAGADMARLSVILKALDAETIEDEVELVALPTRAERVDAIVEKKKRAAERRPEPRRTEGTGEFPPHNANLRGATDIQGKQGPEIVAAKWMNGRPDTEGKVVMIEFWATWCGPCIAGIPHLNELQSAYRDDMVIIAISDEDSSAESKVRDLMRSKQMNYTIAMDPQRRMYRAPSPRGIPHCFVMSPDGVVRWQGHPARLSKEIMGQIVSASVGMSEGGESDDPAAVYERHSWVAVLAARDEMAPTPMVPRG